MASSNGDESIYNMLAAVDPQELERRLRAIQDREQATLVQQQEMLEQSFRENSSLPMTISSVTILGANNARGSFLKPIFDPLLSANHDRPYTQSEVLQAISGQASKLRRFGIYQGPMTISFDQPRDRSASPSIPIDLSVFIKVKESPRLSAKTGTDIGNAEGNAYANVTYLNAFGGAERLDINASLGTRTRSSYEAIIDTPLNSNPDLHLSLGALQSTTSKPFASHEEFLRGAFTRLRWSNPSNDSSGATHELAYSGVWRQITSLSQTASPTVRNDAGDTFKSSLSHIWRLDRRDHPTLPTRGSYMRTLSELAGWGPLKGDVAWWKSEIETQSAFPLHSRSGVSLTTGLRAGVLYPMSLSSSPNNSISASRMNDRFHLGGPTDVRGFRLSGLGPHDGPDAVGGDIYAAGSANLLVPFPRLGKETPLRLQAFVTGGRLLALRGEKEGDLTSSDVQTAVQKTLGELGNGLPSMSAGIGVVYALDQARFELNFSLPLVLRKGEEGRKGVSFGVGLNFL